MKIKTALLGAALAGSMFVAGAAQANTITFDDIADSPSNGYHGFNWNNVYVLNGLTYPIANTGYTYGVVSSPNVAFDGYGDGASFSVASGTFTLNSAYFTGAWANQSVTVNGYNGGNLIGSVTFAVSDTSPTLETFNWAGLTSASWTGSYSQIAVDNLQVNAIPETSTWIMMLAGFAGLGALGYRRNKAAPVVA